MSRGTTTWPRRSQGARSIRTRGPHGARFPLGPLLRGMGARAAGTWSRSRSGLEESGGLLLEQPGHARRTDTSRWKWRVSMGARQQFECEISGGLYASPAQTQIGDGCGISGSGWRESAAASFGEPAGMQNPGVCGTPRVQRTGPSLAPLRDEKLVVRAAVLSIVLTLAIGPNATLLCSVWCRPDEAKSSACQHQDAATSPLVTGGGSCQTAGASATALIREDARRGSPLAGAQHAIAVSRFRFAPPSNHTARPSDVATSLVADARPHLIALRV